MKKMICLIPYTLLVLSCNSSDVKNYYQGYCEIPDNASVLTHDDMERGYFVYAPDNMSGEALPVILNFHGYGGTIDDYVNEANLRELVNTENIIVVYPQGSCLDGVPHWNAALPELDNKSTVDDLGFVETLINQLSVDYNIDQERIYACGYSNGGMMAYALACYRSDLIAAIGSVSGVMLDTSGSCEPNRAIPLISLHGTDDYILPYFGDSNWTSVSEALNFWATNNNTDSTPELTTVGNVARYQFLNGDNGSIVEHYKIFEGEHVWFDLDFQGNNTENLLWNFFNLYDRNGLR